MVVQGIDILVLVYIVCSASIDTKLFIIYNSMHDTCRAESRFNCRYQANTPTKTAFTARQPQMPTMPDILSSQAPRSNRIRGFDTLQGRLFSLNLVTKPLVQLPPLPLLPPRN